MEKQSTWIGWVIVELVVEFIVELVADLITEVDLVSSYVTEVSVGPVVHTFERPYVEFVG